MGKRAAKSQSLWGRAWLGESQRLDLPSTAALSHEGTVPFGDSFWELLGTPERAVVQNRAAAAAQHNLQENCQSG